jgi:DNA-binding transcriptional LysR family regulator
VTTTNDFGRAQLRPWLDAFQAIHTGIQISLLLNDSNVDLLDEHIDLAIRSGPLPDSTMRARLLYSGKRMVCASPQYWARAGKPTHPNQLVDHNCLILARAGAPLAAWPFREGERQFSVKVSGDRQASDGGVLREWVVNGVGVTIKNCWDVRAEMASRAIETALEAFAVGETNLYAVYPGAAPSRRVAALVEFLAAEVAQAQAPCRSNDGPGTE